MPIRYYDKEIDLYLKEINRLFSKNGLHEAALENSFMQRDTKFKPEIFVALCTFIGNELGTKTLTELCGQLQGSFDLQITSEGLNQRFNKKSVEFLKEIFHQMLMKQVICSLPLIEHRIFNRILILDSTSFDLPADYEEYEGPNGSGVKAQLEYELYTGTIHHLDVQRGKASDSNYAASIMDDIQKGDLILRDLGYVSQKNLLAIDRNGGYYISKLKNNTNLYQKNKKGNWEMIDKETLIQELSLGETVELEDVRVGGNQKDPLITSIIVTKLTEEQEEKRQVRLTKKKRKGQKPLSAEKNISINIFATNIPQTLVDRKEIYSIYSLRWQVIRTFGLFALSKPL